MRAFAELGEREILALAISNEEEDGRLYADLAEELRPDFPASARVFTAMAAEEGQHRHRLLELYQARFGDHIPLIRRQDVRGFAPRRSVWQAGTWRIEAVRQLARQMEADALDFYRRAATSTSDVATRKLLGDLADEEVQHERIADTLVERNLPAGVRAGEEREQRRLFLLRVVQPGLAGLMDGSVSTLAPIFAAAFATGRTWDAFVVGLAASLGAGISMGFAEALSDNGALTGRGAPLLRGLICGLMTAIGGIGHTLPFLIGNFWTAVAVAVGVVVVELAVISWIRWRFMDTPPFSAAVQVMFGGALVFATGVLIGNS